LDPRQRRHRRLAMRVDDRIADGVELALSWRPGGVRALLTLLDRADFCSLFARLPGDEAVESTCVEREGLEIADGRIIARQRAPGPIAEERYGRGHKLLARGNRRRRRWWRRDGRGLWCGRWRRCRRGRC